MKIVILSKGEVKELQMGLRQVPFMRNALAHAGKSGRRVVSATIVTAFAQDHANAAEAQWRQVADQVRPKLPKLAALLDKAEEDVPAYMASLTSTAPRFTRRMRSNKSFVRYGGMLVGHGRPRGEEWGGGSELHRAA